MTTLYGISNCDTVKRARRTLDDHGIAYRFHDFRKDGLDAERVAAWLVQIGPDTLINRRGTTWRALPEADKALTAPDALVGLLCAQPALIKRPLFEHRGEIRVGFARSDEDAILRWLAS